jgi:nucleotide-binding universal stress UspA family protein
MDNDAGLLEYERIRKSYSDRLWSFIADQKDTFHYDMKVSATSGGELQSIVNYVEENDIHLVFLGNKGKSGLGRWFFGTVTRDLLRHPPCKVISIPSGAGFNEIKTILVCTDLSTPLTEKQCTELKQLADHLNASLKFLHVQDKVEISLPEDSISVATIRSSFGQEPLTIAFTDSIAKSVNQYISQAGGELVVTLPHHHSWLDNLFLGSETANLSDELSVPILSMGGFKK